MPPAPKHCLLVVDDEPDVCDAVQHLLRREFRVLKATSAAEGCRLMEENEVHIIMTDQRMPKITGVELLKKVRVRHPQAVRLLYTGYADSDAVVAAINQGHVFGFLSKPWEPEELEAAVREAAAEYDRLVEHAEKVARLEGELEQLRQRVASLEEQVRRLGGQP